MAQPTPARGVSSPTATRPKGHHHRYVLADPVAFRYLEEDPATDVLARQQRLAGYECYLVEQWICSRTDPTFIVVTYSGDRKHTILVNVLAVPIDKSEWSPRLKVYFKAMEQYHARQRETPLGTIMITNLSAFPSSLTVIPIPDGDPKAHRGDLFVNEDLKRLGCSGRVGISLSKPNQATIGKFYQLYRASDKVPFESAVVELVKLCQVALTLFGKLDPEYADGLLCDVTENAINDWWVDIGSEYFSIEPHDGILGPTTVAALLGMLMGARNRLHADGAPVPKDVFDVENTKRGIAYFQKSNRLPKTRRLDRPTLARLHRVTNKAAAKEGWFVPRAVKSTMAELGGKGGEMVMDMVGARDKAGIADVESTDIELFVQHVSGERAKWLWQGKPRKSASDLQRKSVTDDGLIFQTNHQGGYEWSSRHKRNSTDGGRDDSVERDRSKLSKRQPDRGASLKSPDSGSQALRRIKGAVPGLRSHPARLSRDDTGSSEPLGRESMDSTRIPSGDAAELKSLVAQSEPSPSIVSQPSTMAILSPTVTDAIVHTPQDITPSFAEHVEPPSDDELYPAANDPSLVPLTRIISPSPAPSIAGSTYRGVDLEGLFEHNQLPDSDVGPALRRTHSFSSAEKRSSGIHIERWARHMSFSLAEDSILTWDPLIDLSEDQQPGVFTSPTVVEYSSRLREAILELSSSMAGAIGHQLAIVRDLDHEVAHDIETLETQYLDHLTRYRALSSDSKAVIDYERRQLLESVKEIDVLRQKLEYEINGLRGKVEDVEEAVDEFERQVVAAEGQVALLEKAMMPKEPWGQWLMRIIIGGKSSSSSSASLSPAPATAPAPLHSSSSSTSSSSSSS
jgi:hypothetical protein